MPETASVRGVEIDVVIDSMEYIRTATLEYPTGAAVRLEYDGRAGNLLLEGADTDRMTVQIVAHVNEESAAAADTALQRIVDGIHHSGNVVAIRVPQLEAAGPWFLFSRGVRVDYAITAPRRTVCQIAGRSGRVEVARIDGPVEISQRSGRTSVRQITEGVQVSSRSGAIEAEEIGGNLLAATASGRVTARAIGGDAQIQSASGGVRVENVAGSLTVQSASGRVEASEVGGGARLSTASGRLSLAHCGGAARLKSASGSVRLQGSVRGDIEIETVSGGIDLDVDPRRPFYLDAETRSGSIRSDLTPRRGGAPPEGAPTVRLRSVSGSIRISEHHVLTVEVEVAADEDADEDAGELL
jgi:hypothetical protein